MMPYPFNTDLSDLTDAQMQVVADIFDYGKAMTELRFWARWQSPLAVAIIAIARLMRDHPELFEKPVDPLLEEARKVFVKHHKSGLLSLWLGNTLCKNGALEQQIMSGDFDQHETMLMLRDAIKRGMELAKGGEA